jgi:hypothetical protein
MNTSTTQSDSIAKLAEALSKAQGEITGALKESKNPFFKSSYADLASCWDACRKQLSQHGLAVIQTLEPSETGVTVVTTLAHSSGEWIRGSVRMTPVKNDPQGIGSCITYARRYALAAIVGLAQIDDDANQASGKEAGNGKHETVLGEHNPRGDLSSVDPLELSRWVSDIGDFCKQYGSDELRLAQLIKDAHAELNRNHPLYIAVADELAAKKIMTKAIWKQYLKHEVRQ